MFVGAAGNAGLDFGNDAVNMTAMFGDKEYVRPSWRNAGVLGDHGESAMV
jgi:hypothetical protein